MAALDAWFAARANHASQVLSVIVEGDSTFAGQVRDAASPNYSPITRVRYRFAAAGLIDGGHGVVNGALDTVDVSGDPSDAGFVSNTGAAVGDNQNLRGNYTGSSLTVGAAYQVAVYGTRVRVSFARYSGASTINVDVDGSTVQVTVPAKTNTGGTADGNWQAGTHYVLTGLTYGRHVVTATLVTGRLSVLIAGTRDAGVVLNNYAARGEKAVDVAWHQFQDWAGLSVSAAPPTVPALPQSGPTARLPALGIYAKGINDQQGNGTTDTSAAYQAKATDFARAMISNGASAIICGPWWESAGHPEFAANFRAAAIQAATDSGALYVDLSQQSGGALSGKAGDLGGANANPHLTQLAYSYQGDAIADALLAGLAAAGIRRNGAAVTSGGYRAGGATCAATLRRNGATVMSS